MDASFGGSLLIGIATSLPEKYKMAEGKGKNGRGKLRGTVQADQECMRG